jgi:hypothetical protein
MENSLVNQTNPLASTLQHPKIQDKSLGNDLNIGTLQDLAGQSGDHGSSGGIGSVEHPRSRMGRFPS